MEDMNHFIQKDVPHSDVFIGAECGSDVNPGRLTSVTFFVLQKGLVDIDSLAWQGCFLDFRNRLPDTMYGEVLPFHNIKCSMRQVRMAFHQHVNSLPVLAHGW